MGIQLTRQEVDIAALRGQGGPPGALHAILSRGPTESWSVAHSPLALESRVAWGPVESGDYLYIPLIPYLTHEDYHRAIQYGITLGLRAGLDAQLVPGRDIRRLHLATGTGVERLAGESGLAALRFYLGVAVQMR